jgi:cyclopropane fatty-acyl-phospholipid synthase-like methyltransferase
MDPREVVERGYDAVAFEYAKLEPAANPWPRMRRLEDLLARLPDGSRVLDVGCGAGIPAAARVAREHRVTGVDISERQIELARVNVPHGTFQRADISTITFPVASFDAIVAFYSIEHLPRDEHAQLFQRFGSWLPAGGYLLFTIEAGEGAEMVGDWLGAPMYVSQHDTETTLGLVRAAGFEIITCDCQTQIEGDRPIDYVWILARRLAT